jgi:hypothetical protein
MGTDCAGADVAREKRREWVEANSAMSFCAPAEDYLQRGGKALVERSREEVGRFLKLGLAPRIAHLAARDVCSDDIVSLVVHVAKRSDSVARRCFGLTSIIFAHGVAKGIVKANPCVGLRLTAFLGPRPALKPRIKLTGEELSFALASFPTLGPVVVLACKILVATCVRKSELLHPYVVTRRLGSEEIRLSAHRRLYAASSRLGLDAARTLRRSRTPYREIR